MVSRNVVYISSRKLNVSSEKLSNVKSQNLVRYTHCHCHCKTITLSVQRAQNFSQSARETSNVYFHYRPLSVSNRIHLWRVYFYTYLPVASFPGNSSPPSCHKSSGRRATTIAGFSQIGKRVENQRVIIDIRVHAIRRACYSFSPRCSRFSKAFHVRDNASSFQRRPFVSSA